MMVITLLITTFLIAFIVASIVSFIFAKPIEQILERYRQEEFHALRRQSAAACRFVSLHVLVPGA